jgi:polyisoprenoid-binding protein YceI
VLEVTRWQATLDGDRVTLTADPHSLRVREALHGVKPLTDRDREEILRTVDKKVLQGEPITFTGAVIEQGDHLDVDGDLTIAGTRRRKRTGVTLAGGRAIATIPLRQSEWDIEPYRGLMGALRVRDEVEVVLDVRLPQRPA